MGRLVIAPLEPLATHAAEAVAPAVGKTLALWPVNQRRRLPSGVASVQHLAEGVDGPYDTIVSVGQLGTAENLPALLEQLKGLLAPASVLLFCEPTIAADQPSPAPPHDVTGALWAHGLTVFECNRFRVGHRRQTYEYCWGQARLRPSWVPASNSTKRQALA